MTTLRPSCCQQHSAAAACSGPWSAVRRPCCERCVPNAEARQSPGQAQSLPSFVRIPFDHHHQQQQQPSFRRSPAQHQTTAKTQLLQFQLAPSSFVHRPQPPNALGTVRQSFSPPRQSSPRLLSNCLSAPVQGRPSAAQPPPPPGRLHFFGPRRGDEALGQGGLVVHQPIRGQCICGGRDQCGGQQREEAVRTIQQPNQCGDSNHATSHGRDQSQGVGYNGRDEQSYYEARKYEGEGGGQENDEYQQMSVHDIKKMFDKPDQKSSEARTRIKQQQQQHEVWMRYPAEGPIVPGGCGFSGPRPDQPTGRGKPMTELIHRGLSPSANEYHRKPFSPRSQTPYGQSTHETTQQPTVSINKQGGGGGGAYVGIRRSVLPVEVQSSKTDQRKSDFDPNQSAAYNIKVLLEEEEGGRKALPQRVNDEEREEAAPNRQTDQLGPTKPLLGGSRLMALLERDAARMAPYKDGPPTTTAREQQASPYDDQRTSYHEPPPRPSYDHEPHHLRPPPPSPPPPPPPPSHGVPVARHYGGYNHNTHPALPRTFYVD